MSWIGADQVTFIAMKPPVTAKSRTSPGGHIVLVLTSVETGLLCLELTARICNT